MVEKVRYMISDVADIVHVETHVLRYWEEELDLSIPRNEVGHRYYTRENIQDFLRIKELKEQGYQLKEIKGILSNHESYEVSVRRKECNSKVLVERTPEERMQQFQELMNDIVGHAIALNNEELSQQLGIVVQERVIKEMDYLVREQDAAQEARYKKLDAAIRGSVRQNSFWTKRKKDAEKKLGDKPAHA